MQRQKKEMQYGKIEKDYQTREIRNFYQGIKKFWKGYQTNIPLLKKNWKMDNRRTRNSKKAQRKRQVGHIIRLSQNRTPRRIQESKIGERRRRGRPGIKWRDQVERNIQKLETRN